MILPAINGTAGPTFLPRFAEGFLRYAFSSSKKRAARLSFTARIQHPSSIEMIHPARSPFSLGMAPVLVPLRPSSEILPIPYTPSKGVAKLPLTARIERAHSYRARSASKKGAWPPLLSSLTRKLSGDYSQIPIEIPKFMRT